MALRPNDPWTQERLAFALFQSGAYGEASEHFARSLTLSHPDTQTPARFCMLGQAQKEAALQKAAKVNLTICLEGLEDSGQRLIIEGWIADIEANPK